MDQNGNYANRIALGWIALLLVLVIMLLFMTVFSALDNNAFAALHRDPGHSGLKMMAYVVAFYAVMPIFVYIADSIRVAAVRWFFVAMAAANFFFLLLHHLSHWHGGDRPDMNSHALDIAIHAIGLWLVYSSVCWARMPSAQRREG